MAPGFTNGTYGDTEIVAAKQVTDRMAEMLSRPDVDHVKVWRIDGRETPTQAAAKAKRRAASKRARTGKH